MRKIGLLLCCIGFVYAAVQQMVMADSPPVTQRAGNDVMSLAAEAKEELPPELKSSLLRDLQHKEQVSKPKYTENNAAYAAAHVSNSAVLAWANEAMVATFSYDFMNIAKSKQMASNYYTPEGWRLMGDVHKTIGDEDAVVKEQLVAAVVAVAPAKIIEQKNIEDRYSWLVEIPLLLTMTKTGEVKSTKLLARFMVVRDNPQVHDRGLAINNISLKKI